MESKNVTKTINGKPISIVVKHRNDPDINLMARGILQATNK